jgi:hypothetical protein
LDQASVANQPQESFPDKVRFGKIRQLFILSCTHVNNSYSPDTWEATLRTAINQHQSAYWLTNPLKICEYKRLPLRKRVFILKSVIDWVLEDSEMLQRYIDRQKTDKMVRSKSEVKM